MAERIRDSSSFIDQYRATHFGGHDIAPPKNHAYRSRVNGGLLHPATPQISHLRSSQLIDTVIHQYNRHQQRNTTASHSRYVTAQDSLRAHMQRMTDSKYNKLRDDIADAVSTFQHDSSVWWKLIERVTRPAKYQHMTPQKIRQKAEHMKAHQQQLLGPHTVLDAGFNNDWYTHVEDYMEQQSPALHLHSDHPMLARITLADIQAAVKQLHNSKHPGHDKILNEMLKYGGEALQQMSCYSS
jgi:hypothetical protein